MTYKIYLADPFIDDSEIDEVVSTLKSGWVSQGPKTREFEEKISDICGVKHTIAMCNGTATLHTALLAAGVKPNNNVICPSMSYISTSNSIIYCGAQPKFVDIDINAFQFIREKYSNWWIAPALSTIISNIIDSYTFFFSAFYNSEDLYMAKNWLEICGTQTLIKIIIGFIFFLPIYGLLLNIFLNKIQSKKK